MIKQEFNFNQIKTQKKTMSTVEQGNSLFKPLPEIIRKSKDHNDEIIWNDAKFSDCDENNLTNYNIISLEPTFHVKNLTNSSSVVRDDLNEIANIKIITNGCNDGSDSGIEFGNNLIQPNSSCMLQRALSSNSGGYSSSCGGLEEPICGEIISCDSSMISYCSDLGEIKNSLNKKMNNDCCTSEGGSESSSITGGPVSSHARLKKKVTVNEVTTNNNLNKMLKKSFSVDFPNTSKNRSMSGTRSHNITGQTKSIINSSNMTIRERARSRDKGQVKATPPTNRGTPTVKQRPPKPDSFPIDFKDPASPAIQRIKATRTPSITRGRTPGTTPTDDGRWPSIGTKGNPTVNGTPKSRHSGGSTNEGVTVKTRVGALALDNNPPLKHQTSTIEKYATLPRRRKEKSADDLKQNHRSPRSNSITRDNRMTSSTITPTKKTVPNQNSSPASKTLPPYPRPTTLRKNIPKTKIYHEISVQTAITGNDLENEFSGAAKSIKIDAVETCCVGIQTDIRDKEIEQLKEKLNKISLDYSKMQTTLSEKQKTISDMEMELIQEREEKLLAQRELHSNSERVLAMLESVHHTPSESTNDGGDSLLILESQIIKSEHILEKQQMEIERWKSYSCKLQNDVERSLRTQRNLIQQRDAIEKESYELQDFLQTEKATLVDALQEIESETNLYKEKVKQKEVDLERLQEECRHLVRIIEQRRQENMGLQSKYLALESRSREVFLQQSASISGATVALGGLGARLDNLVEQLISSYNISERELEDVIYHNEAYTNSVSSGEGSPEFEVPNNQQLVHNNPNDGSLSPQRGQSFLAAVICAIKNAASLSTTNRTLSTNVNHNTVRCCKNTMSLTNGCDNILGEESDSTEMLDSETEPCLMMENVLEDVTLPDSHSHNLISTSGIILSQVEIPSDGKRNGSESLHNLSQAIENRQQIELQTSIMANNQNHNKTLLLKQQSTDQSISISEDNNIHESATDIPSLIEYSPPQPLVDQVIEVDNLVTKLLKVLRIIQIDNDNCIQLLISNKNKLQLSKEELLENVKEKDELNYELKNSLKETSQNLVVKQNELALSKTELQRHRTEIDRLNEDICNLSTLISQNMNNPTKEKEQYLEIFEKLQDKDILTEPEILCSIMKACSEIPVLPNDKSSDIPTKKLVMNPNWCQAVLDAKRQYEAIDRALETLNNLQSIVQNIPELIELQRDLEQTNFQSANILPLSTALLAISSNKDSDFNANASNKGATENGIQINGGDPIDSTA